MQLPKFNNLSNPSRKYLEGYLGTDLSYAFSNNFFSKMSITEHELVTRFSFQSFFQDKKGQLSSHKKRFLLSGGRTKGAARFFKRNTPFLQQVSCGEGRGGGKKWIFQPLLSSRPPPFCPLSLCLTIKSGESEDHKTPFASTKQKTHLLSHAVVYAQPHAVELRV